MRIRGRHAAALLAAVSLAMPAAAACAGVSAMRRAAVTPAAAPAYTHAPHLAAGSIRYGVASGSIPRFDKATRVRASLAVAYTSMSTPISPHFVSWARLHADGAEPVIEILPRGHSLRGIASGSGDRWLRQLRAQITTPVVVSFAPEANGPWYTWGNNPRAYITAWRHVHRVLGTQHITWLWQMSSRPSATKRAPGASHKLAEFYPGSKFVSWVGFDGYFEFPSDTFGNVFGNSIHAIRKVSHRPVLLSETSVGPEVRHVATDITSLISNTRSWHLLGFIWFDADQHQPPYHQDWNLESLPKAVAAFRKAARG